MSTPTLTVVLPAYDEESRLGGTLVELLSWADRAAYDLVDVIVSDDGSTDGTRGLVERLAQRDPRVRLIRSDLNRGKGAALREGMRHARSDLVAFLDADLPVSESSFSSLVAATADAGLVVGSRRSPGSVIDPPQPMSRRIGGWTFRLLVRAIGLGITSDPQCGAKVLRREELQAVVEACTEDRFAFDCELLARSRRSGRTIAERPVRWRHVDGSTLRPVRDGLRMLRDLVRLRVRLARLTAERERPSETPDPPPPAARGRRTGREQRR